MKFHVGTAHEHFFKSRFFYSEVEMADPANMPDIFLPDYTASLPQKIGTFTSLSQESQISHCIKNNICTLKITNMATV
jgi:hypothetical protein